MDQPPALTATTSTPAVQQEFRIDVGTVSVSAVILIVAVLFFTLIIRNKFPPFRAKVGDSSLEVHPDGLSKEPIERRRADDRQLEIDEAIDVLIDRKHQVERRIMAGQIRTIRDHDNSFDDFFPGADQLVVDALWNRFAWELYMAAVENHILSHVRGGGIDPLYLEDKISPVKQRYRKLAMQYEMRPWEEVEIGVTLLMQTALEDFVTVARREWNDFNESVEASKGFIGTDNPAVLKRLKRLLENTFVGD